MNQNKQNQIKKTLKEVFKKETITINISKDTHLKLLQFRNYIYKIRGEKWKFDTIISILLKFHEENR